MFMVDIFNIKRENNVVSCNYIPENSGKIGAVEIDAETFEVINVDYSDYEYGKKLFVSEVRAKIEELLKLNKPLPTDAKSICF